MRGWVGAVPWRLRALAGTAAVVTGLLSISVAQAAAPDGHGKARTGLHRSEALPDDHHLRALPGCPSHGEHREAPRRCGDVSPPPGPREPAALPAAAPPPGVESIGRPAVTGPRGADGASAGTAAPASGVAAATAVAPGHLRHPALQGAPAAPPGTPSSSTSSLLGAVPAVGPPVDGAAAPHGEELPWNGFGVIALAVVALMSAAVARRRLRPAGG